MKISLQTFTAYDKSLKWDIHRNYFLKKGADAWLKGEVPYNITSNSYAAYQTAYLLYQTVKIMDKKKELKKNEKIIVMELASGLGLFALNFIKQFEKICINKRATYFKRFQYFFTDFSEKNLHDATKNIYLRELQKKGQIIFAVVDALNPTKIKRLETGKLITDIKLAGIIANYTHDNLPLTILRKKDNIFYEKTIALSIKTEKISQNKIEDYKKELIKNPISQNILNNLIEKEKYLSIDQTTLDSAHKQIMNEATKNFHVATITYPYGSFKAIKEALPLLKKGGFYFISDIGYANESFMEGKRSGAPSIYGNSFAHNVNFPLIEKYAQNLGLITYRTSNPDYLLHTMVITPDGNKLIKDTFNELFVTNNSNEDASQLKQVAESLIDNKKFTDAIIVLKHVLKIFQYDAHIYYRIGNLLRKEPYKATEAIEYLTQGQNYNYFNLYNFDFELGRAYYKQYDFKKSLGHYQKSLKFFGATKYIFYNIGLCYLELNENVSAKKYFLKALKIDGQYKLAKDALAEVLRRING